MTTTAPAIAASTVSSRLVLQHRPDLRPYEELYRKIHADPELSLQESRTAAILANQLKLLGYEVKTQIGGHGLVGIFRNGSGKTVMLRGEMDALPIKEETGLQFASVKRMVDIADDIEKPVAHACGHDMHVTSLLAAAELLHRCRDSWSGTLVIIYQPNEERGAGAQAMVDDGLYDENRHNVPKPQFVLGGHVMAARAGTVSTRPGIFNSAADSFFVTLFGRGGHGSRPHLTVDPVVLASSIVMKLQTIVSRETNPLDAVVVTVGALQAGSTENVISAEATLKINTRTLNTESRTRVRAAIERIIAAECMAAACPKPPLILESSSFPLLYNDEAATAVLCKAMIEHFGTEFSSDAPISMGSEDFGNLANPVSAAGCFWNYGGIDPNTWDDAFTRGKVSEEIPGIHSASFAPVIQPTMKTSTDAYATAALAFLL